MNDDDISLRHLRVLSLLFEVQSLTVAAEILGTNQPTISKMLSRLRAHFGDPLFVRVGHSMHPTPRALDIAQPLQELLDVSEVLRTSPTPFDPEQSHREFRVLVTEVGMIHLVPQIMQELERAGPRLRLKAVPLDSRQVSATLETGEADIAIGAFPKASGNLRRQKLYSDPYVSVVRKDHPRLARLDVSEVFLCERHIIVAASSNGHAAHQQLEKAFKSKLEPDRIQLSVPSFVAAAFVASRTDAVGSIPSRLAKYLADELGLAVIAPPLNLPRIEIGQLWHERVGHDAGHRWFRSRICELFGSGRRRGRAPASGSAALRR